MEALQAHIKPRKWYTSERFPLIPVLKTKKATEHNTSWFSFSWLFINLWSLDSPEVEISFVMSWHWGIGFTAILPYLRLTMCIPCPMKLTVWIQRNLWRKPKLQYHGTNG